MCRQQVAFNDIFSETTRARAFIFDLNHCIVDLYQVLSVGGTRIQNYSAAGVMGLKMKYAKHSSFPELLGSGA